MDSLPLIILLGAIQGSILGLVLFIYKMNRPTNRVLSLAILAVSTSLLLVYFQLTLDYKAYPFLIKLTLPLSLVFIPLIYIYTKIVTLGTAKMRIWDIKYFTPFLVVFTYNIPFYFGSAARKIAYYERENITNTPYIIDQIEIIIISLILLGFSLSIIALVLKMRQNFENEVANYKEKLIRLIAFIGWSIFVFILTDFLLSIFHLFGIAYPPILGFITAMGATFLIYFIGYYALLYPEIFKLPAIQQAKNTPISTTEAAKAPSYEDYLAKIIQYMEKEKPYKDSELTLASFAKQVNLPAYLVSKILNSKLELSFYNFINKYRIEEVKSELLKTASPQILIIAFEAGFNSKSSFYNYFKKHVGKTPKVFIKEKTTQAAVKKSI